MARTTENRGIGKITKRFLFDFLVFQSSGAKMKLIGWFDELIPFEVLNLTPVLVLSYFLSYYVEIKTTELALKI